MRMEGQHIRGRCGAIESSTFVDCLQVGAAQCFVNLNRQINSSPNRIFQLYDVFLSHFCLKSSENDYIASFVLPKMQKYHEESCRLQSGADCNSALESLPFFDYLSIMFDDDNPIPFDNVRGLLQDLTTILDDHFTTLRKGTRYESLRKSDTKVFILASRQPRSMAAMAKDLAISRQAVHDSVKRLVALEVVEVVALPNNSRDKIVAVTERGLQARLVALSYIEKLEAICADILGKEEFELFRKMLVVLLRGLKQQAVPQDHAIRVKSSSS